MSFGFGTNTGGFGSTSGGASGFGSTNSTTSFGATAGGFGSGFGGFGAKPSSASATGFGGFGASNSTFQAPSTSSFGGFGSVSKPAASSGFAGFGSAPSSTTATTGFGAFGQTQPQQSSSTSMFGQPQMSTSGVGLGTGFGGFGAPATTVPNQFVPQGLRESWEGENRIKNLQLAYAAFVDQQGNPVPSTAQVTNLLLPNEEKCEFDAVMYDLKSVAVSLPKHPLSQRRQEEADNSNPDPENSVAVRVLGIAELRARAESQQRESETLSQSVAGLRELLSQISQSQTKYALHFEGLRSRQVELYHKTLRVLRKVEVLRLYRKERSNEEIRLQESLLRMTAVIRASHDKLIRLINFQSQQENRMDVFDENIADSDLDAICNALESQREGLQVLSDIISKDVRDVQIMKQSLNI